MSDNLFNVYPMSNDVLNYENIPSPSRIFIPEWYKDIPKYTNNETTIKLKNRTATNSTIKHCSPFLDAMTAGYMISLSEDIEISWDNELLKLKWNSGYDLISDHSESQKSYFPTPEGYYDKILKWNYSMAFNIPEGYSVLCLHPSNRVDLPFITLNGIVDCDSYNLPLKFPFFIRKKWSGIIKKDTPIAQIIPIKRDSWSINILDAEENETNKRIFNYFSKIDRPYKNIHWKKKDYK